MTRCLFAFGLGMMGMLTVVASATAQSKPGAKVVVKAPVLAPKQAAELRAQDLEFLLKDVKEVGFPGVPGEVIVFGENAVPLVIAKSDTRDVAIAAATRVGKGRVVGFGHPGFLEDRKAGEIKQLMLNAFLWTSNKKLADIKDLRVGVRGLKGLVAELQAGQVPAKALDGGNWVADLKQINVLVMTWGKEPPEVSKGVAEYVNNGGGLVVGMGGWIWQGYSAGPGETLKEDCPLNLLCGPSGLVWGDHSASNPAGKGNPLPVNAKSPAKVHAIDRLAELETALNDPKANEPDMVQQALAVREVLAMVPYQEEFFGRIDRLIQKHATSIPIPSAKKPLGAKANRAKVLVALMAAYDLNIPIEKIKASPAAAEFPGAIPASVERAKLISVDVDTKIPDWHSTGCYAAPGEIIKVTVPANTKGLGLRLQVGCHRDRIHKHDSWKRMPELTRSFDLDRDSVEVGSPYGGLLYVIVPDKETAKVGPVTLQVAGAVRAPLYIHGQTDLSDWRLAIRDYPAPFGELVSDKIILTVRTADLKKVDFPDKLMEQWRSVIDAFSDLAGLPRERKRPERIVPDVEISAGWLHSGYPIMAQDLELWSGKLVNYDELANKGEWGFYHEIGHNHQIGDWTFEGTGEVTNNFFVLYVLDTLNKGSRPHDNVAPKWQADREKKYIDAGRSFDEWKKDPFLALIMYEQLAREFGWEPFKKVFAEYRTLKGDEKPKSEEAKRDQWMVRVSKAVGKNLSPFFDHWGIPVSDSAKQSISTLPPFTRADLKAK